MKKDKTANKDYYYLYNGHGDVVQNVDTSGKTVNEYSYDEWGNITGQIEGTSNSFKYAGKCMMLKRDYIICGLDITIRVWGGF